jgi:hypothetical protein
MRRLLPGLNLPNSGRLAFFYSDGHYDDESAVGVWGPTTRQGARVVWLHPEQSTPDHLTHVPTPAPPSVAAFAAVALTAIPTLSWPTWDHPDLQRLWSANDVLGPRPGVAAEPVEALYQAFPAGWYVTPHHQVSGHPFPEQGPVDRRWANLPCAKPAQGRSTIAILLSTSRPEVGGYAPGPSRGAGLSVLGRAGLSVLVSVVESLFSIGACAAVRAAYLVSQPLMAGGHHVPDVL